MSLFDELIENLLIKEGDHSNHKDDSGGDTRYGITIGKAKQHGWTRGMKDFPLEKAIAIYKKDFWVRPKFSAIASAGAEKVAAKLFDMGVNIGVRRASIFFQKILNALNKGEELYPDLETDSFIGQKTLEALESYLYYRDESVLVTALACLQGEYYIFISRKYPKNESFTYGWLKKRVQV